MEDDFIPIEDILKHGKQVENKPLFGPFKLKETLSKAGKSAYNVAKFVGESVDKGLKSEEWKKTKRYLAQVQKNYEGQNKGDKTIDNVMSPIIGTIKKEENKGKKMKKKKKEEDLKFNFL